MKEMRARRAAEKLVEAKYGEEVQKQKSKVKEVRKHCIIILIELKLHSDGINAERR